MLVGADSILVHYLRGFASPMLVGADSILVHYLRGVCFSNVDGC